MSHEHRDVLVEFSFESTLCDLDADAVLVLTRQIWRSNVAAGVTGEMRLLGSRVRQVLEGRMGVILPVAARILADPRHTDIKVGALGELAARRHVEWRMHGLPVEPRVRSEAVLALFERGQVVVARRKRASGRGA